MRNLGVLSLFVVLSGCDSKPSVSLEVLSPLSGETKSSVKFRVKTTGSVVRTEVSLLRKGVEVRSFSCGTMSTCDGELEATPVEDEFEIIARAEDLVTEPQTVKLNGELVSLAPVGLGNPKQIMFVKGSRADIDPASLVNVKVTRQFAFLPYIDVIDQRGFGLRSEEVAATAELRGQQLIVKGEFDGPARYTVDLTGVTNVFGKHVLAPHEYGQPYFTPSIELGDVFPSGAGTPPHFERSNDGRLFLLTNGKIRVLNNRDWEDVVTWNDMSTPLISPEGIPWLFSTDSVRKWNGTSWDVLPSAPLPASVSGEHNAFLINAAFAPSGALYVATSRAKSAPYVTHTRLFRFEIGQWVEIATRAYSGTSLGQTVDLTRFDESVVLILGGKYERFWNGGSAVLPDPMELSLFSSRPVLDADGHAWLVGTFEDTTQSLEDVVKRFSGIALLRFDGTKWVLISKRNLLADAWSTLSNNESSLHIRELKLRSFGFDAEGNPMLFARETVNPFGVALENNRFNISAYVFRDGAWGPMRGARSPLLSDELQLLPNPYPPMAPVVAYDAAYDSAGHLWTVNLVGSHGGSVATRNFVVSFRQ